MPPNVFIWKMRTSSSWNALPRYRLASGASCRRALRTIPRIGGNEVYMPHDFRRTAVRNSVRGEVTKGLSLPLILWSQHVQASQRAPIVRSGAELPRTTTCQAHGECAGFAGLILAAR